MTEDDLKILISTGEGEKLDFKEAITSREKIAKTLVAFANTKGGQLLIGVKDNGRIKGIDPVEEQEMLLWASESYTSPVVPIQFNTVLSSGRQILVAKIEESQKKPHVSKGEDGRKMAYLRSKDQTLKASKVMFDVMRSDAGGKPAKMIYGEAEKKVLELVEFYNSVTIKQLCKEVKIPRKRIIGILVNLIRMKVIKVLLSEKEDHYTTI